MIVDEQVLLHHRVVGAVHVSALVTDTRQAGTTRVEEASIVVRRVDTGVIEDLAPVIEIGLGLAAVTRLREDRHLPRKTLHLTLSQVSCP